MAKRHLPVLIITVVILSLLIVSADSVSAQNIPSGDEPGAVDRRFEQDTERQKRRVTAKPLKAPEIDIQEEAPKPEEQAVSFVLNDVLIEGSTIFTPADFKDTYDKYLFQKIAFGDIESIINAIKSKYKKKGCLTTSAFLPEQEIKGGVVTIKIIEGKMGGLKIEGSKWFPSKIIRKYIHVKKNDLLDINALERDIIRIDKNSDLDIKTVISAGTEPETSDITLKATDYFPYHFGVSADNQGTRLVGKERATLSFRSSDITANNDSLYTSFLFSKHSNAQSISYSLPLDTYGAKMGIYYSHYDMRLGKEYTDLIITGDTKSLDLFVTKELFLSGQAEGYITVGLYSKSTKKHFNWITTADDQERIPYIGFDFTVNDAWGTTSISPKFNFGTSSFLGASSKNHPTATRAGTGGYFFKFEQNVTRLQRMFLESYSVIKLQVQAASTTLSPSEQMQIGGANTVRGYPEGDFLCDTGAILNFDWIFPFYPMPADVKLPYSDIPLRQQIQPVIFTDFGGGRINKITPSEMRDKFLASFGGGIRVRLYKNVFARFEWAKDIGAKPTPNSGTSTFHFAVQTEI